MEIHYSDRIDPEELGEQVERELNPSGRGGGGKSHKGEGFGGEHRSDNKARRIAEETKGNSKELALAKQKVVERIQLILKGETNPSLHKGIRNYFEWVRYGLLAIGDKESEKEIMDDKDLDIKYIKGKGAGGQNVNKTATTASIRHNPTMFFLKNKKGTVQFLNKEAGKEIMYGRLVTHIREWKKVVGSQNQKEVLRNMLEEAVKGRPMEGREADVLKDIQKRLETGRNLH